MMRRVISAGAMVLLTMTIAWAADVAGKWTAKVPATQGQAESDITFVFKVAEDKVTGTINNSQQAGEVEIKDGKIVGDELTFSLIRKIGENNLTVQWKGKIAGDEIKFTRSTQGAAGAPGGGGAPLEVVAKRVK